MGGLRTLGVTTLVRFVIVFLIPGVGLVASTPVAWQPWIHLTGVFDVAGPRSDGMLVANGGQLSLLLKDGTATPFARGSGGYAAAAGAEAYLDVSPGLHVAGANCDFAPDDVFIIRPSAPFGVTRIDPSGHITNFATLSGIDGLNGIVFDRIGRFDHRLLVMGPLKNHSVLIAIDCNGSSQHLTDSVPSVEGGLAVAPLSFTAYAGDLIAPDEVSGKVWAIDPTGRVSLVLQSSIKSGGDTGVESEGFVPKGFLAGGTAYVADRMTPGSPHPGTDTILKLEADQLKAAGVREGDLLIAAEGGAVTIDIHCDSTCTETRIVPTETTAHIEGHVLLIASPPPPTPTPSPSPGTQASGVPGAASKGSSGFPWPLIAGVILAAAVAAAGALGIRRRL